MSLPSDLHYPPGDTFIAFWEDVEFTLLQVLAVALSLKIYYITQFFWAMLINICGKVF